MQWLSVILAVITLLVRVTDALAKRRMIDEVESGIVRAFLKQTEADLAKARDARLAARKRDADPDRLRDDDGFKRD